MQNVLIYFIIFVSICYTYGSFVFSFINKVCCITSVTMFLFIYTGIYIYIYMCVCVCVYICVCVCVCLWAGAVQSVATCCGVGDTGIESRCGRDFPHPSRPALGPIQPPVQKVPGLCRRYTGRCVALTTHPYQSPRLKKE